MKKPSKKTIISWYSPKIELALFLKGARILVAIPALTDSRGPVVLYEKRGECYITDEKHWDPRICRMSDLAANGFEMKLVAKRKKKR